MVKHFLPLTLTNKFDITKNREIEVVCAEAREPNNLNRSLHFEEINAAFYKNEKRRKRNMVRGEESNSWNLESLSVHSFE